MKLSTTRLAILITAISIVLLPVGVQAHGDEKGREQGSNKLKESVSIKVKENAQRLQEKVTKLETQLKEKQQKAPVTAPTSAPKTPPAPAVAHIDRQKAEQQKQDKKRICDENKAQINSLIDTMDTRREATFDRITRISDAAQGFYNSKNLQVDNYDNLLAAVTSAKIAAQNAKEAQLSIPQLDCESAAPKNTVESFRQKREASIAAIKIYRDAVKTLIDTIRDTYKASVAATHKRSDS